VGLLATIAAASAAILTYDGTQGSEVEKLCLDWMRLFFETPLRTDKRRYFDSDLCFFTLLLLSGRYRIW
jgi:oligosaccharide reducing-end xylanase